MLNANVGIAPYLRQNWNLPEFDHPPTFLDWLSLPDEVGAELLFGRIDYKSLPSLEHGRVQRKLGHFVDPFDRRSRNDGQPGGWWIGSEVDIIINGHGLRPDMVGWRRDKHREKPKPGPNGAIEVRPDWIAEVLSPSNRDRDLKIKLHIYQDAGVPHYWTLDPENRSLLVHSKRPESCIHVDGGMTRTIRAEPFDALELHIPSLFDEPDDPSPPMP